MPTFAQNFSDMGSTRITIVRHGETEMNVAFILQGHLDSPLTANGLKQAEMLAETIKTRKFDRFYSSDLGRAKLTANIINKDLQYEIVENVQLRERAFGIMEGLYLKDAKKECPEVYEAYITRDPGYDVPEGESLVKFSKRIMDELNFLANKHVNQHILVVAHGGVLDCVIRNVFNINLQEKRAFTIRNTSVNTFLVENKNWILEEWGNIEHIQQGEALNESN